ncbi:hypothetical protein MLD38_008408 [Melastoma candidum]|uniref:Uncharacterized protein n=1 Tax=Melastoma candidum TaxID=119954 RepID=A0ACB9RXX6_9MYRT|nr:hypothetical protein MLD38_008408 [Melastoma candidum]
MEAILSPSPLQDSSHSNRCYNTHIACPPKPPHSPSPSILSSSSKYTLGYHLAHRLVQIGICDVFSVPGDFNLTLLDHLIAEPGLNNVGCCNELNAGYAADGYARARGVGACVVTFTVGGLSIINAIAGAYSENLPVICIVGGPNTNDYGTNRILHHTIGLPDFTQELRCFQTVTCYQAVVKNLEDAREQIDKAISTALEESKPAYISISCNLASIPHPTFSREPIPFAISARLSNRSGLEEAVEATAAFLNKAVKPVLVAETGESWFNCQKLKLPRGCCYEFQMQYGSIGWSVGATLGYAQSMPDKRVIACISDGSFQVTAQDVSTMIRCRQKSIIFLINNKGDVIKNWNYTGLVDAIHNGEGNCWAAKVSCERELVEAIATARGEKADSLCFIEVMVHKG